jgi:SAM-dependent methyltransferase
MQTTPSLAHFDQAYRSRSAPWVIGEPQPAIVELQRAGLIRSKVLDVGCGTGEHTILLTRLGYDVLGIDFAPHAVKQARANAADKGVDARFEVADAMKLGSDSPEEHAYQTIVDSALFHIFDDADRARYVSGLLAAVRPGGLVHVLALSDAGRGFGPQVSEPDIREAFDDGWVLEALGITTYRGVMQEVHSEAVGLPIGTRVDEPAWLARARRV